MPRVSKGGLINSSALLPLVKEKRPMRLLKLWWEEGLLANSPLARTGEWPALALCWSTDEEDEP
jgi:hypothetical protein